MSNMSSQDIKNQTLLQESRRARENEAYFIKYKKRAEMYEEASRDPKHNDKVKEQLKRQAIESANLAEAFKRKAERHKRNVNILK